MDSWDEEASICIMYICYCSFISMVKLLYAYSVQMW